MSSMPFPTGNANGFFPKLKKMNRDRLYRNSGDTILNRCLVLESPLFSAHGQTGASRHERTGRPLGGDGVL